MSDQIFTYIAGVLLVIVLILKFIHKNDNDSKLQQRHIDEILDATCNNPKSTNEEVQPYDDSFSKGNTLREELPYDDSSKRVSVILVSVPDQYKIPVIKEIRAITYLGLKEAKDVMESTPSIIKENVSMSKAREIKKILEIAGARVEIKE